jgi:ankyrin repeat protein
MKITISGPAVAFNSETEKKITSVATLKKLHGIKSEDSCIDYLDPSLEKLGLQGGHLEFVYDEPLKGMRVQTVYLASRELKPKELKKLVEETCAQWSDGIGEGEFGAEVGGKSIWLDASAFLGSDPSETVRVEQVDDGVKIVKPRVSPLLNAAKKNDVAKIKKLLTQGEDVNAKDRQESTPLIEAVRANLLDAVRVLIEAGAELNRGDKHGSTPLFYAVLFGSSEIVKALLEAGADPDYCDPRDYSMHPPLHMACNRKKPEAARLLVEYGADVNLASTSSGYTALMYLGEADTEIARFLIEHGADPEAIDLFGKGMNPKLKQAIS